MESIKSISDYFPGKTSTSIDKMAHATNMLYISALPPCIVVQLLCSREPILPIDNTGDWFKKTLYTQPEISPPPSFAQGEA